MEVTVLNRQRSHRVNCKDLSDFVRRLAGALPADGLESMAICLVSERRMREYNRRFRGRSGTTDVLSFPASGIPGTDAERYLGDIVISVATAAERAVDLCHSLDHELKLLALHGYLHLLGYDHETDGGTMLRVQQRLVRRLLPARAARGDS